MGRRNRNNSKGKLYLLAFIGFVLVIIWLGTRDIPNNSEEVTIDITEQVKAKK